MNWLQDIHDNPVLHIAIGILGFLFGYFVLGGLAQ